jgi:hypothetical protein
MIKEKLILQLFLTDAQYLLLIVVVIVIIYCNSIGGAFIWDDRAAIVRNLCKVREFWSFSYLCFTRLEMEMLLENQMLRKSFHTIFGVKI